MADETATERLREMLDERGEPYTTNDHMGAKETSWRGFTAYQLTPSSKLIMHPTPEQAIAATLGGGELTAEQVRKVIEGHVTFYEGGDYDEQAIADELNAAMGNGTCEVSYEQDGIPRCSNCQNIIYDEYKDGLKNYCDECGAKVRKEVSA